MKRLQITIGFAVVLLFLTLGIRTYLFTKNQQKLCTVLYHLVARSGATVGRPGTPGYDYYHSHPTELEAAHRQNHQFLNQLPCKGKP